MNNKKAFLICLTTLILTLNINLHALGEDITKKECKYPDYAYEFTGKDKCENFNRKMFIFNRKLNKFVIKPVNVVWASILPKYGIKRVANIYTNLEFPKRLVCCLLQKDLKGSGKETVRFLTNSTLGIGGMYDPAKKIFKFEQKNEDAEQVLSHYKVGKGAFLVLPIIAQGNVRGMAGKLIDYGLDPSSYIVGPITMLAKAGAYVNKADSLQPIIKTINSTYADPYDITKKLYGIENFLKNSGLASQEVFAEKVDTSQVQNDKEISGFACDLIPSGKGGKFVNAEKDEKIKQKIDVKADITLENYNPQSPVIDSMRTALFEVPNVDDSMWSEQSVWNRSFSHRVKSDYVKVEKDRASYKFRYILQKNKNAPLAILYPSLGEGVMSHHPVVMAKILYDEGYSIAIQGSTFQWEFVKSMKKGYTPGMPSNDAELARITTRKIIDNLESKKGCKFSQKIIIGTSFGALTSLFLADKEEKNNTLGISHYIAINPPIEILYSLTQLDKNSQDWKNDSTDIRIRAAATAGKIMQLSQLDEEARESFEALPFDNEEAKLIVGFIMKQKLSDIIFTIENCPQCRKSALYDSINNMSYYDYAKKYLLANNTTLQKLDYDTSLYSITDFLQKSNKYKIYHALDDYLVNKEQLAWLKQQTKDRSTYFSNGSHLGFLYRKEFIAEFKKEVTKNLAQIAQAGKKLYD